MVLVGLLFNTNAQSLQDYPWLSSVIDTENCCENKSVYLYRHADTYDFIYIENDADCLYEGGSLYDATGTPWCKSRPDLNCLEFYNFQLVSTIYTCSSASEIDLFDRYDWLNTVADKSDCCSNNEITLYRYKNGHEFILISPDTDCSTDNDKLYYKTGQFWCGSSSNRNCVEFYGLTNMEKIVTWSCDDTNTPVNELNKTLFSEMQEALGGASNIANATAIKYEATGIAMEFQEDPEPIDGKVADYTYSLLYNLDGTQSKQAWNVDADYAYFTKFTFEETIDGTKGYSDGPTGTFSARFGSFGVTGDPMFSTKVAARQKTLMMSSPLAVAKLIAMAEVRGSEYGTISIGFNTSALGFGASTPDIELIIDTNTKLPIKIQVLENDPLLGDVIYEVLYSNWTNVNGLQVPQNLEHQLDGNTIRTESLSNIEVNPAFDVSELMVVDTDAYPYDVEQAKNGHLSSQFHYRTILQTFPIDFPTDIVDAEFGVNSQLVPSDPNAYLIAGELQSHYTFAFKVDGGVLIYDSPVNDSPSSSNKVHT